MASQSTTSAWSLPPSSPAVLLLFAVPVAVAMSSLHENTTRFAFFLRLVHDQWTLE